MALVHEISKKAIFLSFCCGGRGQVAFSRWPSATVHFPARPAPCIAVKGLQPCIEETLLVIGFFAKIVGSGKRQERGGGQLTARFDRLLFISHPTRSCPPEPPAAQALAPCMTRPRHTLPSHTRSCCKPQGRVFSELVET